MGLRYLLQHPARALATIAADPAEVWNTAYDRFVYAQERKLPQCIYKPENSWEQRLHELLNLPWPCSTTAEFSAIFAEILASLTSKGVKVGPESYETWNDGDVALVRAIYCLTRHLRPANVVETGVAHGVTSRIILESMARNGLGHLWSIDLPPENPELNREIGVAVGDRFGESWTLIQGSSRRKLPELLNRLGEIDIFIHDSLHSARNVCFELDLAWPKLRKGGAVVVDDIDANYGFQRFIEGHSDYPSFICEADPIRPDHRRVNDKGMFGMVIKEDSASRSRTASRG